MDGWDESTSWWQGTDDRAFLAWLADRSTAPVRHLAPVLRIGHTRERVLVAEVLRPAGERLGDALDRLGVPTVGVAVTLTVPLLELAVAAARGAVALGTATLDDVLVDDSGAVVLCDRPDGAVPLPGPPDGAARPGSVASLAGPPDGGALVRGGVLDGVSVLLLAARTVWERVDPRETCRTSVDQAVAAARTGGAEELEHLLRAVRQAAPPRPVRWEPERHEYTFRAGPASTDVTRAPGVVAVLREVVEHGIPVAGRRIALRQAAVGVVVAVGLIAAATFALGSG